MATNNGFTPTEKRIMDVLSDWKPHTQRELLNAVDAEADNNTLAAHITNIREKLAPKARDIVFRRGMYNLASTFPPDEE